MAMIELGWYKFVTLDGNEQETYWAEVIGIEGMLIKVRHDQTDVFVLNMASPNFVKATPIDAPSPESMEVWERLVGD